MALGFPHLFANDRLLSAGGGSSGATVSFYYTGTTNLAPIYTDASLTIAKGNPVSVAAGAVLPSIYLDPSIAYRAYTLFSDGSSQNIDPAPILTSNNGLTATGYVLAANIGTTNFSSNISVITVTGYSVIGSGAGSWVSDTLATSALATSCPRYCKRSADGRYWRLLGPEIFVEQGGATGVTGANDQPAVQGAFTYAAAVGIYTVSCQKESYTLWATLRTTQSGSLAPDGHYIVITNDVEFRGCTGGTTFTLLNSTGGPYSTSTQTIPGSAWYGGAIYPWPNGNNTGSINRITMTRITMTGLVGYTLSGTVPTGNTGPNKTGVNLYGKGFWAQGVNINNLYFNDCEFWGFYAEITYFAMSNATANIYVNNLRLHDSPQSAWNPSGFNVTAVGLVCYNTNAVEILGGPGQTYTACKFSNMNQMSCTGGPANGLLYNYAYPTRDLTKTPPWLDFINCQFDNINQILPGNYIRFMRCRVTDTSFYLVTNINGPGGCGSLTSSYFDIDYTVDTKSMNPIFSYQGISNLTTLIAGAPAGVYIQPANDFHIIVNIHRTAQAIAGSFWASAMGITGLLDPNSCSLTVRKADGMAAYIALVSSGSALPFMICEGPSASQLIGAGTPWTESPSAFTTATFAIAVTSPRMGLDYTGIAATIPITMATTYTYANGQRVRIWWYAGSTPGTIYSFATTGAGLALNSACSLSKIGQWLELEYSTETSKWHEVSRNTY